MKIHLEPKHPLTVEEILRDHQIHRQMFAFGSRVRGDRKKHSDLDLLYKSDISLTPRMLTRIQDAFKESDLPITVDLVEWSSLSEDFKSKISSELVKVLVDE